MKGFKFLVLTLSIVLFASSVTNAKARDGLTPDEKLRAKITKLIEKIHVDEISFEDRQAVLEFIVTRDNKIVVLNVQTNSVTLEKSIKRILNYHKIDILGVKKMTAYRIDVTYNRTS